MKHVIDALSLKVEIDFREDDLNNGPIYRDEKIPECGAVYVLWNGDSVAYVGMTKDLNRRVHEHAAEKEFTHFTYFGCDDHARREELEIILYELLEPVLNKEHPEKTHLRSNPARWWYLDTDDSDDFSDEDECFSIKIS